MRLFALICLAKTLIYIWTYFDLSIIFVNFLTQFLNVRFRSIYLFMCMGLVTHVLNSYDNDYRRLTSWAWLRHFQNCLKPCKKYFLFYPSFVNCTRHVVGIIFTFQVLCSYQPTWSLFISYDRTILEIFGHIIRLFKIWSLSGMIQRFITMTLGIFFNEEKISNL